MSEVKVNKISPRTACGTVTLGDSGDSFVIPSGATITNNGTQTGFGRTGTVDWQTDSIKTATFTAANGEGYFANTSGGAFTMNLPAGSAGAIVSVVDYSKTFDSNALTISPNGSEKIGGVNADAILNTEGQSVTLVYVDGTNGWINTMDSTSNVKGSAYIIASGGTETTSGDWKIHTFTGPGTFTVSNAGQPTGSNTVDYLVVAGGGGGGTASGSGGGGGGAGGYRASGYGPSPLRGDTLTLEEGDYAITVGAGGATGAPAARGSNSVFSGITSTGGGGGFYCNAGPLQPGGSGGGVAYASPTAGGVGNTPPTTPPQGNPAGAAPRTPSDYAGSGGGGATAAGGAGSTNPAGPGGAGAPNTILGPDTTYAGGGGGGGGSSGPATCGGSGGAGGGGAGKNHGTAGTGDSGTANTGGGGGAGGTPGGSGGVGGSGIVVVRGPSTVTFSADPGPSATISTHPGGDKLAKFTASGTLTIA